MSPAQRTIARRMGIATVILSGGVLLSRLTGHLREAIIIALNGAGGATDAYYAAFTLPDMLNYMLAGGAFSIAFLPIFSSFLESGREEEGWRVFSAVVTILTLAMLALVLVGEVLAPWAMPLLVKGFPPERLAYTVRLTRIVMPAQLAFCVGGLVQATLYAKEVFWVPALSPLIYNLSIITGGLVLRRLGVEGFAWGVLAGAFLGPFLLPLVAARRSLRYTPRLTLRDPGVLRFIKLSLPLMLGVSLLTVDQWISRRLASGSTGAITHLDNARRLMLVPTAVLGQAAGMAALPFLAKLHTRKDYPEFGRVLGLALRTILELTVLAATWLAVLAVPAVLLVFGWGRNTPADVQQTAAILVAFCVGIPAWGLQGIGVRGFYAREDTLTPMIVSSVVVIVALPLYWSLHRWLGVFGLAVATSGGMSLTALATLAVLRYRKVPLDIAALAGTFLRALAVAAVAGGACWGALWATEGALDPLQPVSAVVLVGGSLMLFAGLTLVVARPLGLEGVLLFRQKVASKLGRLLRRGRVAS